MKDKKGFVLAEFTLKMIIAVIVIMLLILLLYNIYDTITAKSKFEKGKATLGRIKEGISIAYSQGEYYYVITEPKGWNLVYYPSGQPNVCAGKPCFCTCEKERWFTRNQLAKCNSAGVCAIDNLEDKSVIFFDEQKIEIDGPIGIMIKKEGENLRFSRA